MPVDPGAIVEAVVELAEVRQLRVTVAESLKGALLTGACAFAGGVVGGPLGLGVGGVVGACVASYRGRGAFRPLAQVIAHDMTDEQRLRMAEGVQRAVRTVHKEDLLLALAMLARNGSLQTLVIDELKAFLLREMRMRLL